MRISEGYRRDENSECETSLHLVYQVSPGQNGHERKDKWKIVKWDNYRENVFLNIMKSMKTRKEVWQSEWRKWTKEKK